MSDFLMWLYTAAFIVIPIALVMVATAAINFMDSIKRRRRNAHHD